MYKSITVVTLLTGIIAVDVVFAQSTVNLPITVTRGESYEGLLTRASQLAEKTIISRFNQQQGLNKIDLLITAEKSGAIAPLLSVKVSRQDWFGHPNIQRWRNVFPFGKDILGFSSPAPVVTPKSPPAAVNPTPSSAPSPGATTPPTALPFEDEPNNDPPIPIPKQRLNTPANR
ncbi:MAG: hypothetical protein EWV53_12060 [Microcystis panniformis Mp_MB_F_20051200_S9]|uniref:Uncharacterized protein n=1 Tax=Microcystis panniformis Mp_MB_F_20051200_S9 TaxID=2486223 RepID=A0A552PXM9_9CHRO|nr:MAG: hypothetical protein EWV42_16210 [Microcystis panniformis Mp_GB_SS_20050300_S99D]TRV49483.1 MAG: hypothetical protein EWV43_08450 [Microcystis panniformis Mp_MB_F_20080800_S26D]TRV50937.1 MAG: hypothetical protein EWV87_07495 [Microcystis panniformis Mp_GB_SS_20050300_S99]TRV61735.1 MAG: hypothetical protein EWV53_12060 [Microcystis panniformis Mp_MB_F_20051200_S9]TRV63102.1 MAG: hypothetical protein EWV69_04240 [Microcystis panniformis Mp_MB_F_20080800_S26]TRV67728.1 MAG: hypothetical